MARRKYSTAEIIVANDVFLYMAENKVSLNMAYEDKKVSKEMKLSEDEIKDIVSKNVWENYLA